MFHYPTLQTLSHIPPAQSTVEKRHWVYISMGWDIIFHPCSRADDFIDKVSCRTESLVQVSLCSAFFMEVRYRCKYVNTHNRVNDRSQHGYKLIAMCECVCECVSVCVHVCACARVRSTVTSSIRGYPGEGSCRNSVQYLHIG